MAKPGSTSQTTGATWDRGLVSAQRPAVQLVRTSYESSGVDVDQYAEAVIDFCESSGERTRRALATRRLALLQDAHAPLIKAALKNWLTPAVYHAVVGDKEDHIDISRNPAKRIWREQASLYNRPPKRTTGRKTDIKVLGQLLAGSQFDLFWQAVELRLQAVNEVLIWPEVVDLPGGAKAVKHRYATPDCFTLVASPDDPTVIEALVLRDEWTGLTGDKHVRYILWSDDWHAQYEPASGPAGTKYQRTGKVESVDAAEEDRVRAVANPYGRLVHTLVRRDYSNDGLLDQMSGEDLVDLTVKTGVERCLFNYLRKMSGFKQLLAYGSVVDQKPRQLKDPGATLRVEVQDGGVQVVDWSVDLKARQEVNDRDEERAAASRGINSQRYKHTGDYQSSHQAQGADRGLTEQRIHDALIFTDAEAAYATALARVARHHRLPVKVPLDVALEVQHAPMEYPTDPNAQVDLDTKRIALGLESAVTVCQREHPSWTEDQCVAHIERNLETTAKISEMKTKRNVPSDPTNESASAEENGALGGRPPTDDNPEPSPAGAAPGTPTKPEEQDQ